MHRFDSTAGRRLFLGLLLLMLAVVCAQYTVKVLKPSRDGTQTRGAINRWASQIQQGVEEGVDISAKYNYPNPPIMALILWPITELAAIHPLLGALVWFYLKVAMAFWCTAVIFKQVARPDFPVPPWACMLAVLASIRPILGDLSHGNVNIFILFLVVGGLVAFARQYDFAAGLLIALAVACKVTPALFLAYFAWKRAWRTMIGATAGLALFFFVVPGLILGWNENLRDLQSWFRGMVLPFLSGGFVTSEHNNQSLPGLIYRLFTHSPSFSTYVGDVYTPTDYHTLVDLGTGPAQLIVKACTALFALIVVWKCRTPIRTAAPAEARSPALWNEFAFIALGMLLFSERTWKHHCVTLLIPNAVLCYALARPDLSASKKKAVAGLLILSQIFMLSTATGLLPDATAKLAQVYGAYLGAFACLAAGLAVVWERRTASEYIPPPDGLSP